MKYSFCGRSGLQLPAISLGLWHNFGFVDDFDTAEQMILYAFEQGITHFDLANNYGPPPGSAETNFGKILKKNLASHRDEMIHFRRRPVIGCGPDRMATVHRENTSWQVSTKVCNEPDWEYFDIFYSHRYDPSTPV